MLRLGSNPAALLIFVADVRCVAWAYWLLRFAYASMWMAARNRRNLVERAGGGQISVLLIAENLPVKSG